MANNPLNPDEHRVALMPSAGINLRELRELRELPLKHAAAVQFSSTLVDNSGGEIATKTLGGCILPPHFVDPLEKENNIQWTDSFDALVSSACNISLLQRKKIRITSRNPMNFGESQNNRNCSVMLPFCFSFMSRPKRIGILPVPVN